MRNLWVVAVCGIALVGSAPGVWGKKTIQSQGTIEMKVVDEEGKFVPEASIYVDEKGVTQLADVHSGDVVTLPGGEYDIVAAWVEKTPTGIIRHISPSATVQLLDGDQASVILPLKTIAPGHYGLPIPPLALSSR